MTQHKIDKS